MNNIDNFIQNSIFGDTETTGVEETAEIIELSLSYPESTNDDISDISNYTRRFRPASGIIPPESSAVHFICMEDLENEELYENNISEIDSLLNIRKYFIGHNVIFDRNMLVQNHERYNSEKSIPDESNFICTLRLAKKLYTLDPSFTKFTLSYLWFKLNLNKDVSRKIIPHSAEDDVYMCYRVFVSLLNTAIERGHIDENGDIGKQLVDFCNTGICYEVMPTGKHKGMKMSEVPMNYLEWMINTSDILNEKQPNYDSDLAYTIQCEINRRWGS